VVSQQNGYYNFGAADDLQSALNAASEKLVAFGGFRAQLVATDLGATDGTQIVGWSGTGYNSWVTSFNAGQRSLQAAAGRLKQLAAQVNNATCDAYEANGATSPIGLLPVGAGAPGLATATDHPAPNGLESAVPFNLYDYAKQTTSQNDAALPQVTRTLQGKIDDYYAGAATAYHSLIPDIDGLDTGGLVVDQVRAALSQCRQADAFVHTVGVTFEDAGNSSSITYPPGLANSAPDGISSKSLAIITLTSANYSSDLANEIGAEDGASLAAEMNAQGPTQALLAELAKNENDPAFAAAFLNGLDHRTLVVLLLEPWPKYHPPGTIGFQNYSHVVLNVILSALASGNLDQQVCDTIVDEMRMVDETSFNQDFLQALTKNPKLAAAFFQQLDEQHLHQLLAGNFQYPGSSSTDRQTVVFTALLSAARGIPDSTNLTAFFQSVGAAMAGITSDNPGKPLKTAVSDFVTYCLVTTMPPLYPGDDINVWLDQVGQQLGTEIQPWVAWVDRYTNNDNAKTANTESLIESGLLDGIEALTALITGPAAPAAAILLAFGENAVTSLIGDWIGSNFNGQLSGLFPQGSPVGAATQWAQAELGLMEFQAIAQLVAAGKVVDPVTGEPVPDTLAGLKNVLYHQKNYIVLSPGQGNYPDDNTVWDDMKLIAADYYPSVIGGLADGGS
jgi:hypothetical protein